MFALTHDKLLDLSISPRHKALRVKLKSIQEKIENDMFQVAVGRYRR